MAIASIAYDQLAPERRATLVALLKEHPRFEQDFAAAMPRDLEPEQRDRWIFMRASVWPDLTKMFTGPDLAAFNRPIWHYIDLPVFLDEKAKEAVHPKFELDYHAAKNELLMNAVQALQKNLDDMNEPTVPGPRKAVALCWVLHLAADLHLPVHGAALFSARRFSQLPAGDRGGNDIRVREKEGLLASFKTPNLHALWACILGIDESYPAVMQVAAAVKEENRLSSPAGQQDPAAWARESNELAKQYVYTPEILALVAAGEAAPRVPLPVFEITDDYLKAARPQARRRAATAANRTAVLLGAPDNRR